MKFNIESPFFQFLSTLCGFIALNIIFLITCIPIITIGSAVTALYKVTLKESRDESGYMIKPYLAAMKEHFKVSTIAFLLYLTVALILFFNMAFWASYDNIVGAVLLPIVTLAMLALLISALYTFPLLARFDNTLKQTILNSYPLAMENRKITILLFTFHFAAILLCVFAPAARIFMAILGFSFLAFCSSYLLGKVFLPYEPEVPV